MSEVQPLMYGTDQYSTVKCAKNKRKTFPQLIDQLQGAMLYDININKKAYKS